MSPRCAGDCRSRWAGRCSSGARAAVLSAGSGRPRPGDVRRKGSLSLERRMDEVGVSRRSRKWRTPPTTHLHHPPPSQSPRLFQLKILASPADFGVWLQKCCLRFFEGRLFLRKTFLKLAVTFLLQNLWRFTRQRKVRTRMDFHRFFASENGTSSRSDPGTTYMTSRLLSTHARRFHQVEPYEGHVGIGSLQGLQIKMLPDFHRWALRFLHSSNDRTKSHSGPEGQKLRKDRNLEC